jgi:predicted RNase H-like nuclease (RuvC/YqgF family)
MDKVCFEKEATLHSLKDEIKNLKTERDHLKALNEKLVSRVEELTALVN